MRLVNDDIVKAKLLEYAFFDQADFVTRNTDFEVLRQETVRDDFGAFFFGACEKRDVEVGTPFFKFTRPILQRRFWYDDQVQAGK